MGVIRIKDKTFKTSISEEELKRRNKEVADQISKDLQGTVPVMVAVLNGAFVFAADLAREMSIPCEMAFVKYASYAGLSSTGKVKELIGFNKSIEGRDVVIVEDIIESGLTMEALLERIKEFKPASVRICTLLLKPKELKTDLNIDYVAFKIPSDFIVGYGLDYDQQGRGLKEIYTLVE